jgi:hypothetical protein
MSREKVKISRFIESISSKNFARAHKYLKSLIEDKITKKIDKATDKPLF